MRKVLRLNVRRTTYIHIPVATAILLGGFAAGSPALADTIDIGVLGPMSGSAAQWGTELTRGAQLRANETNAAGGLKVGGKTYQIKIVPYDHKSEVAEARAVTNRLVFSDKVKFIAGNAIGATTSAAQTITEPNQVLFLFISWGAKNLAPDKPFSFRSDLSGLEVGEPFYTWLAEKHPKIKKIAIISPNDESGRDSSGAVAAVAKKQGMEIVADEYFVRETKDFYPLLTRILAAKPDFIELSNSPGGSAGLLVKQLGELGYKGPKGWVGGLNADVLVKVAGKEAAEGTWSPWSLNYTGAEASAPLRAFVEQYTKQFKESPGPSAVANYIAVDALLKAMERVGSITDTKAIAEKLATDQFDTMRGPLVVGGKDTYGIDRQFLFPVTITEIKDGQVRDIDTSLPAELRKIKAK